MSHPDVSTLADCFEFLPSDFFEQQGFTSAEVAAVQRIARTTYADILMQNPASLPPQKQAVLISLMIARQNRNGMGADGILRKLRQQGSHEVARALEQMGWRPYRNATGEFIGIRLSDHDRISLGCFSGTWADVGLGMPAHDEALSPSRMSTPASL
jgi:hypothetical protein